MIVDLLQIYLVVALACLLVTSASWLSHGSMGFAGFAIVLVGALVWPYALLASHWDAGK